MRQYLTRRTTGLYETNAYSCCRLLWRRDREGRKTLRSAQTGTATNEAWTVGGESATLVRELDGQGRLVALAGRDGAPSPSVAYAQRYAYGTDGWLTAISNAEAVVAYAYTPDGLDAGFALTFANGTAFTRALVRDPCRRDLVTHIESRVNGTPVNSLAYAYDALSRPISRNGDTFAYNVRGEVVSATVGGNGEAHSYDHIGNAVLAASGGVTNAYTANSLNQYTQVGRAAPCPPTPDGGLGQAAPPVTPAYDADGNLTAFGPWDYAYDAANRLVSVSSNGVPLVTNSYDAQSRRVRKVTPEATTTCFYDGWNLVEERIAHSNGTSSTIHYYWGKDLSGKLQGAGGVGGLLYLKRNGTIYVPHYDAYGNVLRYTDAAGNVVAEYTYNAFGGTISSSGILADVFRIRYSTKYLDTETGLYYYGYRFYSPMLMRWLNRDPIGERGGMNLYVFCKNQAVDRIDYLGNHWEFSTPKWDDQLEELDFTVRYIMSPSERKCCHSVTVDRYVRKLLGVGSRFGTYKLDHAGDGGETDSRKPYIGYAESDSPDGQNFYFYRLPWTQSFKWEARCKSGPAQGKILSTIERKFKTSGHWLWNPKREGQFVW